MMCKILWGIQEPSVCEGLRLGKLLESDGVETRILPVRVRKRKGI